jgi:large subunit ribosomal protein L27
MATSKSGGSTQNGRDSHSKRLGCKVFDGEIVTGGAIIVRQRGTKFYPGRNVGRGGDDTLFAKVSGRVVYRKGFKKRSYIDVVV